MGLHPSARARRRPGRPRAALPCLCGGELASRPGREIAAWLADADGLPEALGFVALCHARSGWSIPWLLVHPSARRCGIGRQLARHAVGHARVCGAAGVSVETLAAWRDATAFWTAVGFARRSSGAGDLV
ncbi:MAG: GNAT family N-acetyltransferase [Planctomycetia bacterium]|nr:GNAT family N-acetyltransferase [Planctomycetia bacterium]